MKEKIKKIFTNKNLWKAIIETICAIFILFIGYFSGFASGLLVDDSIRTDLIEKVADEPKNIKKSLIDNGNYNYTFTNEDFLCLGHVSSGGDVLYYVGVEFLTTYNIYYDNYNYTDTFLLNYVDFSYYVVTINVLNDTFLNTKTYYTSDGSSTPYRDYAFGGTWRYTSGLEYSSFYANSYLTAITSGGEPTGDIGTATFINNDTSYIYDTNYLYSDYYSSTILYFYSQAGFFPSYYLFWIFSQQLYTCENDIQNKAIINVSMFQNLFEVFELNHGGASEEELQEAFQNGYSEGYDVGLETGVQAGIDGANNSDSVFDRVFMIIRNAGASFLNLFDFYIFPNMPFYVVIAIPFIIGSLFILFKILIK